MDTKLLSRIAAVAFIAAALTMAALQLREEPKAAPSEVITVLEPDSDPLPATLRNCASMGEAALSSPGCRAAWTEKRRRFLGQTGAAPSGEPVPGPVIEAPLPAASQSAKGL